MDALLGEQTRPHQDLDLAIARDDLPAVQAALAGLGFRPDPTAAPGLPARMVLAAADGRQGDLHPLVFDGHGNGWQELDGGVWAAYPADGLSGVGAVGGRRVRCVTPELQVRNHLGTRWTPPTAMTWRCWPSGSGSRCHRAPDLPGRGVANRPGAGEGHRQRLARSPAAAAQGNVAV